MAACTIGAVINTISPGALGPSVGDVTAFRGDHARIKPGGVLAFADELSYREGIRVAAANDELGEGQLILTGRAFLIPEGTEILVVERHWDEALEVRVLSSAEPHFGRIVWVSSDEHLAKIKHP